MAKMTRDLLNNTKAIMTDAQNLKNIGAFADSMGRSQSFDKYFGDFFTEVQSEIYKAYTMLVAEELYKLNYPNC